MWQFALLVAALFREDRLDGGFKAFFYGRPAYSLACITLKATQQPR